MHKIGRIVGVIGLIFCGSFASAQSYDSGAAGISGTVVKMQSKIQVADSVIIVNMGGQDYKYRVLDRPSIGIIDTEYGSILYRFTINELPKPDRISGYKYTHSVYIASDQPEMAPPMAFYCRLEE